MKRLAVASLTSVVAIFGVLGAEVALARGTERLPDYSRDQLDGTLGSGPGRPLRVAWLGDSTGQGTGASAPEHVLPRVVASRLERPVKLSVLAVSGATAADVLRDQLPKLSELEPEWVFVCVGGNDVIHLTSRPAFRRSFEALLSRIAALQPERIVVVGIGQFASTPLFAQPLRWIAGIRGAMLDADVRAAARRADATYVSIVNRTGAEFVHDPARYHARDRFHPSDAGYALWADAIIEEVQRVGM